MHTIDYLIEERGNKNPLSIAFYRRSASLEEPVSASIFCTEKRALAFSLEKLGLKKGDVVGILSNVRYEWELTEKAALSVGAATFGIDVRHTKSEIQNEITVGSIDLLIVENTKLLQNIPDLFSGHIVLIDHEEQNDRQVAYLDDLLRQGDGQMPLQKALPDDYAVIISTSGTTGTPKLIRYRNRHIVAACFSIVDILGLSRTNASEKITLCWLPLVYMTSKIMNLVDYAVGGKVTFLNNPREIATTIRTVHPSHLVAVPIFYERLYKGFLDEITKLPFLKRTGIHMLLWLRKYVSPTIGSSAIQKIRDVLVGKHLEYCISGSAPLSTEIMDFFQLLTIPILEAYALSENAIPVAMNTSMGRKIGSVGKILPRNTITITSEGEILVKGDGVFEGYIGHESENAEYFTEKGYLKTGDIGRLDEEGFLYLTGRKKNIIKTANGYRISPVEVEAVYETILYIKQILVLGDRQKFLGALIVLDMPHIEAYLANQNLKLSVSKIPTHPIIQSLIQEELKKHEETLAVYKRVACFTLLTDPFSVEKDELTPNFKMRRDIITKHYTREIEEMFKRAEVK